VVYLFGPPYMFAVPPDASYRDARTLINNFHK